MIGAGRIGTASAPSARRVWLWWLGILAALTFAMLPFRDVLNQAHVALGYLIVVQLASARSGRSVGLTVAALAFLSFDVLFVPPYGTLVVEGPLDWLVLAVFLATGTVAAQLFERARSEAQTARARTMELDRLSSLGAETLNAGRAEEAVAAVAEVIRSALGMDSCAVYLRDQAHDTVTLVARAVTDAGDRQRSGFGELVDRVARSGHALTIRSTGVVDVLSPTQTEEVAQLACHLPADARDLLLPLRVRERIVGVLSLARHAGFALEPAQCRFLAALAYYAALGAERVRLVAQAERADALGEAARLKDAVLASVSHDLRTPLTTIKALAHDLGAAGDDRATTIEEEADRLNALVADLLDLSRFNAGTFSLSPEPNELEDLIGAALQRVTAAADGRQISVRLDDHEPLLFGRFDFTHTLRAFVNVIENALKYSPADGPVDITARREGEWLSFSVADRGAGVPQDEQALIFEPFYRPAGTPPDIAGSGLGLSIARAVMEAQGGSLRYEPREGGGSMFTLRVPAIDIERLAQSS